MEKIGEVVYLSKDEIRVRLSGEDTIIEVGKVYVGACSV